MAGFRACFDFLAFAVVYIVYKHASSELNYSGCHLCGQLICIYASESHVWKGIRCLLLFSYSELDVIGKVG